MYKCNIFPLQKEEILKMVNISKWNSLMLIIVINHNNKINTITFFSLYSTNTVHPWVKNSIEKNFMIRCGNLYVKQIFYIYIYIYIYI